MKRWLGIKWRHPRRYLLVALGLVMVTGLLAGAARALSQGYTSSQPLSAGSLVGLDPTNSNSTVQAANTDQVGELIGVVVADGSTLLAVGDEGANVQVVTSGLATALVSSLNGNIKKGDAITVSPINGVGMKAAGPGRILGLAQADFSDQSPGITTKSIPTKSGQTQVAIGGIPVLVAVGYYSPKSSNSAIPQSVQNLANQLAGKAVSTGRILVSALLLLLGLFLAGIILNSAVRSSMESIGRNPLARSAVNSGLLKVLFMTLAILLVTLGSLYLVIKG